MDFQKFYDGDLFNAYQYLGAHAIDRGFVFRVYAPAAARVALIGDFSNWKEIAMHKVYDGQFYEAIVENAREKQMYKFRIYKSKTEYIDHADPYAFWSERRPNTASITFDLKYTFHDHTWKKKRNDFKHHPLNIYEVHAGSWMRSKIWKGSGEDPAEGWLNYRELADKLIPYLKEHHYNAVELMPLAEYPADESWGYQATGFYSATSRYGDPHGLQYLVDQCHKSGIAVILDVVTVHFAVNDYALWNFDGTALYEYPHPAVGYSEWGSCNFMHSRGDVRSFLQSSCAFWLDQYHFDGLRFDAVGNLIYWQGDQNRGVNQNAIKFMQRMNSGLKQLFPEVMLIAEDSTAYPRTTQPVSKNGLGFDYKWDLGWMNDTLRYLGEDPNSRSCNIGKLLFSMQYFYNEAYLLPLSHDEVVHGKGTIVEKMYGDFGTRILQAKLLYFYMFTHPGKKLNFMGNELAQTREWDERRQLDWDSLSDPVHADFQRFFDRLNKTYLKTTALWENDYDRTSFHWIARGESQTLIAFTRSSNSQSLLAVLNLSAQFQTFNLDILNNAKPLFDTYRERLPEYSKESQLTLQPFQGLLFEIS